MQPKLDESSRQASPPISALSVLIIANAVVSEDDATNFLQSVLAMALGGVGNSTPPRR